MKMKEIFQKFKKFMNDFPAVKVALIGVCVSSIPHNIFSFMKHGEIVTLMLKVPMIGFQIYYLFKMKKMMNKKHDDIDEIIKATRESLHVSDVFNCDCSFKVDRYMLTNDERVIKVIYKCENCGFEKTNTKYI